MDAFVMSVNVGAPRPFEWLGRSATSAIWKFSVAGPVRVAGVNADGDDQADRTVHGGPDKALYAYARDDSDWWAAELDRTIDDGQFGENLTLAGVDVTGAVVGERWQIGGALLEVSQPRVPCWKLGARMNDANFPQRFAAAGRPGTYLRIVREGDVAAGDRVRIVHRPVHGLTVGDVARIYHRDRSQASCLLRAPELAEDWRTWSTKRLRAGERF